MPPTSPYGTVTVAAPPGYRGGPAQSPAPRKFNVTSVQANWQWGSDGGDATIIYDFSGVPVTTGWPLTIEAAGHTFWGVCIADAPRESSGGNTRELKFKDNLYWLDYDQVWCKFNQLDDHIVNNRRVKRYVHYLPDLEDPVKLTATAWQGGGTVTYPAGIYFSGLIKTYTNYPFTAAQIIALILNSTSVKDGWTCAYHPDQLNYPVYDIEATGGKSLKAILQEISDQQGLVFAQMGAAWNLYWARKGQLDSRWPANIALTPFPETNPATGLQQILTDDRVDGTALSGHPTQVRILGDRNTYQVMNIPLVPDWSPGWEQFYDVILFREDCYQRGKTTYAVGGFGVGTPFKTIGQSAQDPEQILGRQLALEYSLNVTVAQYAALQGEVAFSDTSIASPQFCDYHKFAGKSRLDMPATLYIEQILLRAFRFPDGFAITNPYGTTIPLNSLEVLNKLIARITYDPITGFMSSDPTIAADGNGLAIALGYEVGKDLFAKVNPSRFNLADWNSAQDVWSAQEFTIDDSGEPGGKVILFNSPIIKSASLVKIIDGYGVFNANPMKSDGVTPGFDIPSVQIGCCFAAERYSFLTTALEGGKTATMQVGGLNHEFITTYDAANTTGFAEVRYADGLTADQKALQYSAPLELLQYIYDKGGYSHALMPKADGTYPVGRQLDPFTDKILVDITPSSAVEFAEYTSELPAQVYTPERDLDRNVKMLTVLPGQAQLRQEAVTARLIASALVTAPDAKQTISAAFRGFFGASDLCGPVPVIASPQITSTLPVGTPLWGNPNTSIAVPPAQSKATHVFLGATTEDGASGGAGQTVSAQNSNIILVKVQAPVAVGDAVGQVAGKGYLSNQATGNFVGVAQQALTIADVGSDGVSALCKVLVGASTPAVTEDFPFAIQKVSETQVMVSPTSALLTGLDCQTMLAIYGLGVPFDVDAKSKIYLEVLFDLNGNPMFANIACSDEGWRLKDTTGNPLPSGFPLLAGIVDNTNLTNEAILLAGEFADHIEEIINPAMNAVDLTAAKALLAAFSNLTPRYNQFYAYYLIAFCTAGPANSFEMTGPADGTEPSWSVNQCLDSHLMLQGFCQAGVPCQVPVPYSGVFAPQLPEVVASGTSTVALSVPITTPAPPAIFYSLDGAPEVQYDGTISVTARGSHTITAYATLAGWLQSKTSTTSFIV